MMRGKRGVTKFLKHLITDYFAHLRCHNKSASPMWPSNKIGTGSTFAIKTRDSNPYFFAQDHL